MLVIARSKAAREPEEIPAWAYGLHMVSLSNRVAGRQGRWLAVVPADNLIETGQFPMGSDYDSGWNGSFHDCQYGQGLIFAWGRTPSRARKRLKRAMLHASTCKVLDSSIVRFNLRALVRPGD
jgi:hypothetical protein